MNTVYLAPSSTVVAITRTASPFVLRCFECDWGYTVRDYEAAMETGIEHEAEHADVILRRKAGRAP